MQCHQQTSTLPTAQPSPLLTTTAAMIKMVCCWLSGALRWIVVAHPGSSDVLDIITEASYFGYHTLNHDNEASTRPRQQTKTRG